MIIDISIFGFFRLYFAIVCPWSATSIFSEDSIGWEFCSFHFSVPAQGGMWYFGWAWDSDLTSIMFGPYKWENSRT